MTLSLTRRGRVRLGRPTRQAPLFGSLPAQHSAPLRIYDRSGVWVATLHAGVNLSEENLLHDLRAALAADSR